MAKKSLITNLDSQLLSRAFLAYGLVMVFIRQVSHPFILIPVLSVFTIALFWITRSTWRTYAPFLIAGTFFTLFIQSILPLPYTTLVKNHNVSQGISMAVSIALVATICIGSAWLTQLLLTPKRRNP